jgi:hypothetical protein
VLLLLLLCAAPRRALIPSEGRGEGGESWLFLFKNPETHEVRLAGGVRTAEQKKNKKNKK